MKNDYDNIGLNLIRDAIDSGSSVFSMDNFIEDFNNACNHIATLIKDAFSCYRRTSYGTAAFLSITAFEETAKAEIGLYQKGNESNKQNRQTVASHQDTDHNITIKSFYPYNINNKGR